MSPSLTDTFLSNPQISSCSCGVDSTSLTSATEPPKSDLTPSPGEVQQHSQHDDDDTLAQSRSRLRDQPTPNRDEQYAEEAGICHRSSRTSWWSRAIIPFLPRWRLEFKRRLRASAPYLFSIQLIMLILAFFQYFTSNEPTSVDPYLLKLVKLSFELQKQKFELEKWTANREYIKGCAAAHAVILPVPLMNQIYSHPTRS